MGHEAILFDVGIHMDKIVKNLIHVLFACTLFLTEQEAQSRIVGSGIGQRVIPVETASEARSRRNPQTDFEISA